MRTVRAILLVVALMVPFGLVASPAGAASGTTCKTASGTATFTPALPKIGSTKKVTPTVKITGGKFAGCTGGGVTSAALVATIKFTIPNNCTTLLKNASTGAKGPETLTWNNHKTSTVTLTLGGPPKGKPATYTTATGPVTAGLFKGLHQSGTLVYSIGGGCTKTDLSKVTFKQVTAQTIK